jgi:hypothetical protein
LANNSEYTEQKKQQKIGESPYPNSELDALSNKTDDTLSFEYTECRKRKDCEYENCPYRRDLFMFN